MQACYKTTLIYNANMSNLHKWIKITISYNTRMDECFERVTKQYSVVNEA
jgi:ribonucleotide reductase beta subunit family protein with ferritin-like domain